MIVSRRPNTSSPRIFSSRLVLGRKIVADRLQIADQVVERGIFADVDEILDASRHGRRSMLGSTLRQAGRAKRTYGASVPGATPEWRRRFVPGRSSAPGRRHEFAA